jgi:hypothetical protein
MPNYLYVCNYKHCNNPSIYCKYCKKHYNIFLNKYAVIIQKNYISYKTRKKIKNIYYKLPNDLQYKIKYYMNQDVYYKKYKKRILEIVNKKIIKYFFYNNLNINFTFDEIIYHYNLIYKYHSLLNINIIKYFFVLSRDIENLCYDIINADIVNILNLLDYYYLSFVNKISFKNLNYNKIIDSIYAINNIKHIYTNYYTLQFETIQQS